jgi:hypothetical protein
MAQGKRQPRIGAYGDPTTLPKKGGGVLGLPPPSDPRADLRVYTSGRSVILWVQSARAGAWWLDATDAGTTEGSPRFDGGFLMGSEAAAPILAGARAAGLTVTP